METPYPTEGMHTLAFEVFAIEPELSNAPLQSTTSYENSEFDCDSTNASVWTDEGLRHGHVVKVLMPPFAMKLPVESTRFQPGKEEDVVVVFTVKPFASDGKHKLAFQSRVTVTSVNISPSQLSTEKANCPYGRLPF